MFEVAAGVDGGGGGYLGGGIGVLGFGGVGVLGEVNEGFAFLDLAGFGASGKFLIFFGGVVAVFEFLCFDFEAGDFEFFLAGN